MTDTALYYALSTIAQCAAALAALIGFLGLWRLDRLRDEAPQIAQRMNQLLTSMQHGGDAVILPEHDRLDARLKALPGEQRRLLWALRIFLVVTLIILGAAVMGFLYVDQAKAWGWTPWLLWIAGGWLAVGPIIVVLTPPRLPRATVELVLLLGLISPALAGPVRCQTYPEPTMGRLQTVCDDGTRAVSTWSPTLQRWESTVTPPPGQRCTGQLNLRTQQVEVRCW